MIDGLRAPQRGPYVIAEIGVNHDGVIERALELVDAAQEAGVDAIKLQQFRADLLLSGAGRLASYQSAAGETDAHAMLRRLELSEEKLHGLAESIRSRGIDAIVTVFSPQLVPIAERAAWSGFKVASPDLVNKPLLQALVRTGRPLLVSTGGAMAKEVERTLAWLDGQGVAPSVFQCVSAYPTPVEQAGLEGIAALGAMGAGCVGYSDHTQAIDMGAKAVQAGAMMLEKHLTYDRSAPGPDHAASLDPAGMREYVHLAREATPAAQAKSQKKNLLDIEEEVRLLSRQSLAPIRTLEEGDVITESNLSTRRPGTGIAAWNIDETVGRCAARRIEVGEIMCEEDVR